MSHTGRLGGGGAHHRLGSTSNLATTPTRRTVTDSELGERVDRMVYSADLQRRQQWT